MPTVVGYAPDESGTSALQLGAMLARSAGDELVVCTVAPAPWSARSATSASTAAGDAEADARYLAVLEQAASRALTQARAVLPAEVDATFVVRHARSVAAGLLELAEERQAAMVVTGSSSGGVLGRVALGSVTERLLHGAHLPVAVAPRGYRAPPDARVRRVTAAYGGSAGAPELLLAVAAVAARVDASLRVASFTVRPQTVFAGAVRPDAEDLVVNEWVRATGLRLQAELEHVRALPQVPRGLESVIGDGYSWQEALADVGWTDGDVLVVGSSTTGPLARVFLGSRSSKILRNSPVPVVMVPRGAVGSP